MGQRRKFDHEAAKRLHRNGLSYAQIGRRLGVSRHAVRSVVNYKPLTAEQKRKKNEWQREHLREPCKGGCGRLVWTNTPGYSGFCIRCLAIETTTSVRPGELLCSSCREWKPDTAFGRDSRAIARRGRTSECRPCNSAASSRRHASRKVPCVNCGRPRYPENKTGLCQPCYLAREPGLLLGPPDG